MSRVRTAALAALIALAFMGSPVATAQTGAARVYVANAVSDTVAVMDATNTVIAIVPVGDYPIALAMTPDGTRVYVANEGSNTVSVIDTATNAVVATVPVGVRPFDVRVTPDGREVWVANAGASVVSVIDTATNTVVGTVPVGLGPHGIAFSPDGSRAYVTLIDDTMAVVDTATRTVITSIPVGHSPHAVEVLPDGSKIYVADSVQSIRVVDAASLTVVKTIPIGRSVGSLAVHFDGTRVYAGTQSYVAVIDTATDTVVDTAELNNPRRVAISPGGDRLYATFLSERVTVLDPATLDVLVPGVFVGLGPQDIVAGTLRQPVIDGSTWFSSGAKSRSGPAGSTVALYAVGAAPGVPYRLVLSRTPACADLVAYLNPTTVVAGPNGLIGTVRGTIPAGTPAGTYWVCFRHTAGATATGVVSFTVA
jgi:YVTN family beta-propeller protein